MRKTIRVLVGHYPALNSAIPISKEAAIVSPSEVMNPRLWLTIVVSVLPSQPKEGDLRRLLVIRMMVKRKSLKPPGPGLRAALSPKRTLPVFFDDRRTTFRNSASASASATRFHHLRCNGADIYLFFRKRGGRQV